MAGPRIVDALLLGFAFTLGSRNHTTWSTAIVDGLAWLLVLILLMWTFDLIEYLYRALRGGTK